MMSVHIRSECRHRRHALARTSGVEMPSTRRQVEWSATFLILGIHGCAKIRSGSALLEAPMPTMQGPGWLAEATWLSTFALRSISNFAIVEVPNLGHEMQRSPATF